MLCRAECSLLAWLQTQGRVICPVTLRRSLQTLPNASWHCQTPPCAEIPLNQQGHSVELQKLASLDQIPASQILAS